MPVLANKYFEGEGDIPSETAAKLLTVGLGERAKDTLTKLGWEGQLIAPIGITLSLDGSEVANSHFSLHGDLVSEPISVKAGLLWEKTAKELLLSLKMPTGTAFKFAGGDLSSDLIPQENVQFSAAKDGRVILPMDWPEHGIGNFCLRAVAHLDKSSNSRSGPAFKVTVLAFPLSVDEMDDLSAATQTAAWPGIRIAECQAELFPRAPPGAWGAPVWPLLNIGNRSITSKAIPPGPALRFAIAETMRTAALPTACTSRTALKKIAAQMRANPENQQPRSPTITWPAAPRQAGAEGECFIKQITTMYNVGGVAKMANPSRHTSPAK